MKLFKRLLELVFPHKCILCRQILDKQELDLCHDCRRNAPEFTGRKDKIRFLSDFTAVWFYEGDARQSLIRFKFRNLRGYAPAFGRLLAMELQKKGMDDADVITWVPVSARRKRQRGYDQVELIARAVSRELGLECRKLLDKHRDNRPNSSLKTESERRANVLGAYRPEKQEEIARKRILLIDDILTTGATASECARVLLGAGAKEVNCAAMAAVRNNK